MARYISQKGSQKMKKIIFEIKETAVALLLAAILSPIIFLIGLAVWKITE